MINEMLEVGSENATTAAELARRLNTDKRTVMQLIRAERLEGMLICANSKGYFMPEDINDVNKTIGRLYKQAREGRAVAEAMKNTRDDEISKGDKRDG